MISFVRVAIIGIRFYDYSSGSTLLHAEIVRQVRINIHAHAYVRACVCWDIAVVSTFRRVYCVLFECARPLLGNRFVVGAIEGPVDDFDDEIPDYLYSMILLRAPCALLSVVYALFDDSCTRTMVA